MRTAKQSKEPIRLREKQLKDGSKSRYLDYYFNGVRKYEFLKLYFVPPRTPVDKDKNAETLRTANAYKAQKIVEPKPLSPHTHLYTISKLMGHKRITTTQIYAKIVDESKRKAVDLIPAL